MKKRIKRNRLKVRYDRVLKCLIVIALIAIIAYHIFTVRLTNIYITGNSLVKDQKIIELASLQNYPKMITINTQNIEKILKKESDITNVKVIKKHSTVTIEVEEATPLYFDATSKLTVLSNGKTTEKTYQLPILVNYVPDTIIEKFQKSLLSIKAEVLVKISEIKYDPNIDSERFLLTMNDGNYVYVNLKRFKSVNNYLTIISNFKDKKGIIYLDSGSHFKLFEKS